MEGIVCESELETHFEDSDYDEETNIEEYKKLDGKRKRSEKDMFVMKRKVKSKKTEFIGWGSKALLEFLGSIGRDITKKLSQYEVTSIVIDYCEENTLYHQTKRKKVLCDAPLRSLFGRKSLGKNSIHKLLSSHFAENFESSGQDEFTSGSEDNDESFFFTSERKAKRSMDKELHRKEIPDLLKSCFALITARNIKLVYLKRSLVEELLKERETIYNKVVGSFVRVKSDPNDYSQRNSHQLEQVKGINVSSQETNEEIFLQLSGLSKEIPTCMLSDDNFSEEECEDLRQRVKDGMVKRPTVVELEEKARSLHKDITKHWIARELIILQKRIDFANEKGRRKELSEFLNEKMRLQNPTEKSRLLEEVPEVIADVAEVESVFQYTQNVIPAKNEREHDRLLVSPIRGGATQPPWTYLGNDSFSCAEDTLETRDQSLSTPRERKTHDVGSVSESSLQQSQFSVSEVRGGILQKEHYESGLKIENILCTRLAEEMQKNSLPFASEDQSDYRLQNPLQFTCDIGEKGVIGGKKSLDDIQEMLKEQSASNIEVIELSDDELESTVLVKNQALGNRDFTLWHCLSPCGKIGGPFPLSLLKEWTNSGYYELKFMVWKEGQSQEKAISLIDAIRQNFPNT